MQHTDLALDISRFPDYFRAYHWQAKHALYGYPADAWPKFEWMQVLERRFQWLCEHAEQERTGAIYLIKEMIQWGGSQNGVLQKFEDGLEQHNLQQLVQALISSLARPEAAITAALQFPGMGLTYASKMLRFMDPQRYGALDSRIRQVFGQRMPHVLPKVYDASVSSMVQGYVVFTQYLEQLQVQLDAQGIARPACAFTAGPSASQWRAADIEMALFGWASSSAP